MKFKRGVIEFQFNWLFVLIIGAVILIMFSGIIIRQKNISETSKNVMLLNNLDAVFSGSESSKGTVNIVKIPETRMEFRCNRYSVGRLSKQLDVMNVFPPSVLEGSSLISMTLDFSMPYRIANLVYLTSPQYRYIFVGSDNAAEIESMMPNETFSEAFSTIGQVRYDGERKSRLVFFDDFINDGSSLPLNLNDYARLQDNDITALNVRGSLESGTIEFFRKQQDRFVKIGESGYIGRESLLGAVFSDNPEIYSCVMGNVFEKTGIVTRIYRGKIERIRDAYSGSNERCSALIESVYSLENIDQILSASSSFSQSNVNKMIAASKSLQSQNKQAQLQSCAVIY
ncbi:hypothetical protein HYU09_03280 [Candidatus Woesearchaeota archaeon]|nr:hypothetical protein [Candidatus Woesearchaeota archaeon]